jgi:hypothetical protein
MSAKAIVFTVLGVAAVALVIWLAVGGGGERSLTFVITDHPGNPTKCKIEADNGSSEVIAYPLEYVKFRNETDAPRTLEFGNARKLFAEPYLTIQPGATDSLQVLEDADADGRGNPHTFKSCHEDVGPPKIIVCPPGQDCS